MSANRRLILKIGAVLERFIIFFHLLLYRKGLDFQHRRSLSEYRVEGVSGGIGILDRAMTVAPGAL